MNDVLLRDCSCFTCMDAIERREQDANALASFLHAPRQPLDPGYALDNGLACYMGYAANIFITLLCILCGETIIYSHLFTPGYNYGLGPGQPLDRYTCGPCPYK